MDTKKLVKRAIFSLFRSLNIVSVDFDKFIILSRSRTGSNLLVSYLNSHPHIRCYREVFKQLNGRNYQEILDSTFSNHPKFVKSVGFKIFYYHPNDEHNSELWETLINMENLRVIHLKRRNILRTLISRKIAEIQDQWAKTNKEIQSRNKVPKQVSISVEDLNKGFNQTRRWENDGAHKFADHPIIDVYYEDLVENKDAELRKIWEFLDVSTFEAKTPLKKQNPESLSELLTNFDEISTYFLDTEWHPFFVE